MIASAQAQPNIALIKYWGKRDSSLNIPCAGSLSLTLDSLWTRTRVAFDAALEADELRINGGEDPAALRRCSGFLDLLRGRAGCSARARVETRNNFPTGAGLASSASGFAALAVAAAEALGLSLDAAELSRLARRGSGSAARSIFGGFVEMAAGERADGSDAFARPLLEADAWPLRVVIAVTTWQAKDVGSTAGMELTRRTSPFYSQWLDTADADLDTARAAVQARDFQALAEVSEHSCLKMHALMLATRPPLLYWTGATVDCLHRIRRLRERDGLGVFFTVDAGPQVKAVCLPQDAERVSRALGEIPGVERVLCSGLGEGARWLDTAEAAQCE
ncbi:MAG TPA: diphosphomevalonate decarboxylase [Rhodanobacteraceae bacterium]|nr:diphosphomevalonate decarboxylase [Rhodanobacteraceae bacterium]